ncbi:hypothetical protein SCOR_08430 [Sulfidibacter corallicola]|uniref:SF4 helicase domain-containing protein n=1 Tax=Sulfidibacter corallicola TaxID=2818388 RepID=A0A8A4TML9_SULCO|nr:hypothetical protein [Sulfidibacter corallicola]QTD51216.1 hypothetical protein J3U87_01995 [Sulfidibacter corallicola]
MIAEEVNDNHPLRLLDEKTGLPNAELSLILARSGVGKSAALINFGIDTLLKGQQILHFSAGMDSEKVHDYYQEIYQSFVRFNPEDKDHPWDELNTHLMVISYRDPDRMIADIDDEIKTIHESAKLSPALVIVDGLDFDNRTDDSLNVLKQLAATHEVRVLAAMRVHRNQHGSIDLEGPRSVAMAHTDHIYFLEADKDRVHVEFQTQDGQVELPIYFCSHELIFRPL